MTRSYWFEVAPLHLDGAVRQDEHQCAIARAVRDHFGEWRVQRQCVTTDEIVIDFINGYRLVLTPSEAMRRWIVRFDTRRQRPMRPCRVEAYFARSEYRVAEEGDDVVRVPALSRRQFGGRPGVPRHRGIRRGLARASWVRASWPSRSPQPGRVRGRRRRRGQELPAR